jgi:2-dehydropantoate 2-reductase
MKIALIGPGAIGGYYSAMLINSGHDVNLIVKPNYLDIFTKNGIHVKSVKGDFSVNTPHVISNTNISSLEKVDLLIITTKCFDTENAIKQCIPIIGEDTTVVSIQNGVDNTEKINKHVGNEKVIGGLAYISVTKTGIGNIVHASNGKIILGGINNKISEREKKLQQLFLDSGIGCKISDNITKKAWTKLTFNCAFNPITAITRKPITELVKDSKIKEKIIGIMKEVIAVSNVLGINVDESVIETTLNRFEIIGSFKSSMQQDIENNKKIELDGILGVVIEKGKENEIPTPLIQQMYSDLKLITKKR